MYESGEAMSERLSQQRLLMSLTGEKQVIHDSARW